MDQTPKRATKKAKVSFVGRKTRRAAKLEQIVALAHRQYGRVLKRLAGR